MIKTEFIKLVKERIESDKKYTNADINDVINAIVYALEDALYFTLENAESIRLTESVRLVAKERKERSFKETTLKHITTGEPIYVPAHKSPAVRYLAIEGLEKEL